MDVMTLSSCTQTTATEACRAPHTRLLVEPVQVPDLRHTGLGVRAKARPPALFYPDGGKNATMRKKIAESLRSATSARLLQQTVNNASVHEAMGSGSVRRRGGARRGGRGRGAKGSALVVAPNNEFKTVATVGQCISGVRPANRKRDEHTKQILSSLRENSAHLDKLVVLACS